ncbi:MAG: YcxB family protein [Ruminococcus sp.]|nr:YcxB family protein [Ruminococcus sp.]
MEPLFVNEFERTFDTEKELYRYLHLTSPSAVICLVILGVVIAADLVMCLTIGLVYANLAVFAMAVIVLFVLLLRYYTAIQAAKSRFAEDTNNRGTITITASLDSEDLISESSDREEATLVPYSELKRLFVTKSFYMLQTEAKMVYVFRKGCFTVGKEEDFLPYVQQIIDRNKRKKSV